MKKSNKPFVSAVIVAAGRGTRMDMELNKQYIEIAGKPVLVRTLQVFEDCSKIEEVILVTNAQDIMYCKQQLIEIYGLNKVKSIVAGGDERQKSAYNGLCAISKDADIVMIHDGARPFIKTETICDCISQAKEFGGCVVAVPAKDTIKVADKNGFIMETLDRSVLWSIQTPQVFTCEILRNAHRKAMEDGFIGTDDAVLVERLGHKLKLVMGSYDNIKITTKEDLSIAQAIVGKRE